VRVQLAEEASANHRVTDLGLGVENVALLADCKAAVRAEIFRNRG